MTSPFSTCARPQPSRVAGQVAVEEEVPAARVLLVDRDPATPLAGQLDDLAVAWSRGRAFPAARRCRWRGDGRTAPATRGTSRAACRDRRLRREAGSSPPPAPKDRRRGDGRAPTPTSAGRTSSTAARSGRSGGCRAREDLVVRLLRSVSVGEVHVSLDHRVFGRTRAVAGIRGPPGGDRPERPGAVSAVMTSTASSTTSPFSVWWMTTDRSRVPSTRRGLPARASPIAWRTSSGRAASSIPRGGGARFETLPR